MTLNFQQVKQSKFLGKHDCDPEITLTIDRVALEQVSSPEGAEEKYVVHFAGPEKPWVLNWSNAQTLAQQFGEDDMGQWAGGQVTLYHEPNISFGTKLVGGIRVRSAVPAKALKAEAEEEIPFA